MSRADSQPDALRPGGDGPRGPRLVSGDTDPFRSDHAAGVSSPPPLRMGRPPVEVRIPEDVRAASIDRSDASIDAPPPPMARRELAYAIAAGVLLVALLELAWWTGASGATLGLATHIGFGVGAIGVCVAGWVSVQRSIANRPESVARPLRDIAEHLDVGLWVCSGDQQELKYFSPAGRRMLELPMIGDEGVVDAIGQMIHPDDRALVEEAKRLPREEGEATRIEFRVNLPSGRERWMHMRASCVRRGGRNVATVGLIADVTERRESDQALRDAAQRLAIYRDRTPLAVVEWNTDFKIIDWNEGAERVFGYTRDEVLGRQVFEQLVPEDIRPDIFTIGRALISGDGGERSTNDNITKDGRRITCDWYNTSLVDDAGAIVGWASLAQDITERVRANRLLTESERRFRQMAESAPALIWMTDEDGRFVYGNRRCVEHMGGRDDALGERWLDAIHPDDRAAFLERWRDGLRHRRSFNIEHRLRRTNGVERWFVTNAEPRFNTEDEFVGMTLLGADITWRKQAEERQALLLRELDHRVGNNLQAVLTLIEQASDTGGDLESVVRSLAGRVRALARLHRAFLGAGKRSADLRRLVRDTLDAFTIDPTRVEVVDGETVELPAPSATYLCLAINELATNACKHGALSRPGGSLRVSWRIEDQPNEDARIVRLEWRELGGPGVRVPPERGFGVKLIEESVMHEGLGSADVRFEPGGVECDLTLRLDT